MATVAHQRTFLFLQGPSSPLFRRIGRHLQDRGHTVHRINLCVGDWVFWHGPRTSNYRGTLEHWPDHVERFCRQNNVTDIVLLGEERPHHKHAAEVASRLKISLYVIEMGYLRPDWVTLERGGMSSNSHFPDQPEPIIAAARNLPDPDLTPVFRQSFLAEAAFDLAFNLPNVFLGFLYPHYRWHALQHPLAEYWGWTRRLVTSRLRQPSIDRAASALIDSRTAYFLFPLQLQTDYQLRVHSPFATQEEAIERVIASFAQHARPERLLVFKIHPLDNGLIDWAASIADGARRHRVADRVRFLAGGDLRSLLDAAAGVVTINSTTGIQALAIGKPTKVIGTALFDIDGLTDRRELQHFWDTPRPPDPALGRAFLRLLAASIHVRGNFYSRAGVKAAAAAAARRLHENTVNEPGAFCPTPPRKP